MEAEKYHKTAQLIKKAGKVVAFTGAGISVESGIPPFRGENGLWNKYNPDYFHLRYFINYPGKSWGLIRKLFYELYGTVKPNPAHEVLAHMEKKGYLHAIVTQNIDNLHQEAGNKIVHDFHGNLKNLVCMNCHKKFRFMDIDLSSIPPKCTGCNGIIKPDIVFFGESISPRIYADSFAAAEEANVLIVIGTTGEVMPASMIPFHAKDNGAVIIEVNIKESNYTSSITSIFLQGKASEQMTLLFHALELTG